MGVKISIITINKNNYEGLQATLNSVQIQKYKSYEHIIIDSNSGQDIIDLCKNYPHISYFISEVDSGIYNAFNKALNYINGEWVLFLNSGDCLLNENSLFKISKKIDNNYLVYYWDIWNGDSIWYFPPNNILLHFVNSFIGHSGGSLFNSLLFKKLGLFDDTFKLHGDRDYLYKIFNYYGQSSFKKLSGIFCYFKKGGSLETNHLRTNVSKSEKRIIEQRWNKIFKPNFQQWNYKCKITFLERVRLKILTFSYKKHLLYKS